MLTDILTGWSKRYPSHVAKTKQATALYKDVTPASTDTIPVTIVEVEQNQEKHEPPSLRIAGAGHCGERGHRAFAATWDTICESYWWEEIK